MQGCSENPRMSSRRSREEKGGSEESRKPDASPCLLWRCELRAAAKQIVLRKTEGEARLAVVCHWVGLTFTTRERQLKKRKILLKILLKPN